MAVVVRRFPGGAQRPLLLLTLVAGFASTIFLPAQRCARRAAPDGGPRSSRSRRSSPPPPSFPHALVLRGETAIAPPASAEAVTSRALLADATFRWLTVAFALATVATVVISVHLVAVLTDRGLPAGAAAAVAGGLGLLSVTGRVVLTLAERRWAFSTLMAGVFTAQAAALVAAGHDARAAAVVVDLRARLRGGVRRNDDRAAGDRRHPVRRPLVRQHQRHAPRRGDRRQGRGATGGGCRRHPRRVLHARALDTRGRRRPRCRRHGPRCSRPPPGPRAANTPRAPTPVPRAPPAPPRSAPARPASRSSAPASHP